MNERRILLQHALTVLVGQLAVISFGVTDTIVAGRYDPQALAALSISSAVYISVYVALMGIMQAILPMLAELHGAQSHRKIGELFHQGLYLLFCLSLVGTLVLISPDFLLGWTKVPDALIQSIHDYLFLLAIALPAALFFRLFSTLNQSIGKPKSVAIIQVAALGIKIPLSVFFTFGFDQFEAQGLEGCAMATIVVNYAMLLVSLWLLKHSDLYRTLGIWQKPKSPNLKEIIQIAKLGIPNGLSVTVEVTSFTMMALFIARLGITASASHQVAANLAALLYMVPLSFAIATSARASYWIGAQNNRMVKKSVSIGFQLMLVISCALSLLIWIGQTPLAQIYVKDPEVMKVTAQLIGLVALYHASDAIQTMCFFVLRSLKVVFIPFLIYTCLLWGLGLGGGFWLAYKLEWNLSNSPAAFWISSSVALLGVSACLLGLLRFKFRQLAAQS